MPERKGMSVKRWCVAVAVTAAMLGSARAARAEEPQGDWRRARWGMTEDEVVASLSGAAVRLAPRQQLADGNVVSLGLEGEVVGGTEFRVRFVFDPAGRLAAVSLRTDPGRPSGVDAFEATRRAIEARLGAPGDATSDDAFIDLRQVTWRTPRTRIDVKYLPGVVVVLYTPAAAGDRPR